MEEKSKSTDKSTESGIAKRMKNLKPAWKKGDPSPNPKGHAKGVPNYATMRERAIRLLGQQNGKTPLEIDDEINANALLEARKGNFQFYKDDKDRVFGQATQPIKLAQGIDESLSDEDLELAQKILEKRRNKTYGLESNGGLPLALGGETSDQE